MVRPNGAVQSLNHRSLSPKEKYADDREPHADASVEADAVQTVTPRAGPGEELVNAQR